MGTSCTEGVKRTIREQDRQEYEEKRALYAVQKAEQYKKLQVKNEKLQAQVERLKGLLDVAKCPNKKCAGGCIQVQRSPNDWTAEQCQWCYMKEQALKGDA